MTRNILGEVDTNQFDDSLENLENSKFCVCSNCHFGSSCSSFALIAILSLILPADKENASVNRTFEIKENNAKMIFYEIPNTPVAAKRKSRANSKLRDEIRKSLSSTVTLRRTYEQAQERRQLLEKRLTEKKPKRQARNDKTNDKPNDKLNETTTVLATRLPASNGTFVKDERKAKNKEKICDVVYLKTIDNLLNAVKGRLESGKLNSNFKDDANYIDIFQENISKLSSHLHAKLKFNAGLKLLRWYRGRLAIRKAREHLNQLRSKRNAAIVIQCAWRRYQEKKTARALIAQKLKERRDAAILTIQKNYRLHSTRKQSNKLREQERNQNASARVIQRNWKVYLFRSRLNCLVEQRKFERAALRIQRNWKNRVFRTRLAVHIEKKRVERLRERSASLIQKARRGYLFRRQISQAIEHKQQVKHRAALLLQRTWRVYLFRKNLNGQIERKIRVQNESAALVQRNWRIYRFKKHLDELVKQRQEQLAHDNAATVIQRCWRGYLLRKHLDVLIERRRAKTEACLTIQRAWHMYQAKKQLNQLKLERQNAEQNAAQLIQLNWRRHVFQKRLASQMRANQEARRNKAAIVVQRAWRKRLSDARRTDEQRKISAAIRIQKTWRGYAARLNCIRDHKNASIILGRISEVNKNAIMQPTVGEKTKIAISKLLNYKYHGTALHLLQELEKTTNLSNESCIQMADLAIIEVLLKVISECNRSEPCLQVSVFYSISTYFIRFNPKIDL